VEQVMQDTAPTQFVQAGDIRFAYRRFGRPGAMPLVFFNHLAPCSAAWWSSSAATRPPC
jgi:pimeloyl-ACP methyl ester carboxylesterase